MGNTWEYPGDGKEDCADRCSQEASRNNLSQMEAEIDYEEFLRRGSNAQ